MTQDEFKTIYDTLGLSDMQLAAKLSVCRSAVFKWRKGTRKVSEWSQHKLMLLLEQQESKK